MHIGRAELIEKWTDALDCADDWTEKNLITEFLEDLHAWAN